MKKICRNLSIGAVIILTIIVSVLIVMAVRKPKNKEIYATSVNFKTLAEAVEIYSENQVVITEDLVNIKPENCTMKPEFLFKKYGQSGETEITGDTVKFESEGRHILICRVKSGDTYYVEDRLIIDVAYTPSETTSFYIKKLNNVNLYIDENIGLDQIAYIKRSDNSTISVVHDEYIQYSNGTIIPLKEGIAEMTVVLKDTDITICQELSVNIKPSIINAEVELRLTMGGQVLDGNVVEKQYSQFNFDIGYTLVNLDRNQAIDCWTDSEIVEVVKYDSPTIRLKALSTGSAIIYVKPLERPDLIFEIIVNIV